MRSAAAGGSGSLPARPVRTVRGLGLALPVVTVVAVAITMVRAGAGLDEGDLAASWQLIDLPVLRDDPVGSVWYLHVQPPLWNLVVGSVLRWSPAPPIGTLFVLDLACLALTGVVLADLGARWRVHPLAAGGASAAAVVSPAPLSSIVGAGYEVPVATGLAVAVWLAHRHLEQPRPALLVGLAVALTTVAMTRSAFHPGWVLAVLALVAVARPVGRRAVLAAFAVPLLVIGGWMGKNLVVVGEPTLSSWVGFNLQRGVTAPMERAAVERDVAAGAVTPLALADPFASLHHYPEADGCRPDDRHPAVAAEVRRGVTIEVANFNNRCYLPLYGESSANAATLLRRHPGRYLATRRVGFVLAFRTDHVGVEDPGQTLAGTQEPRRTWMDAVADVTMAPVGTSVSFADWNLPLLGLERMDVSVSLTLVAGFLVVVARGTTGAVRLGRAGWAGRAGSWATEDVTWVIVASIVGVAVVVTGLVELGENDRFRATVDPFLVALPLLLALRRGRARARRPGVAGVAGARASGWVRRGWRRCPPR